MSLDSSKSSGGKSGNTRQISPSKHWCFTFNNYTQEDISSIVQIDSSIVPKYVFQEEVGESGTPHLQGYICFSEKKRPKSVFSEKNHRGIHWEKCRNIQKSIIYCMKPETRKGEIFTRNIDLPYILLIESLYSWQKDIIHILNQKPDDRTIYWYYEENGCAGKTTFAKWIFMNYERAVVLSGKGADMKNGIIKYKENNHALPKIVIINVPRSNADFLSYTGLEEIKDMFFFSGKYEGGMVCGPPPHVIVFANQEPDYSKMSNDRFVVYEI